VHLAGERPRRRPLGSGAYDSLADALLGLAGWLEPLKDVKRIGSSAQERLQAPR
jgi:hypothetical protein